MADELELEAMRADDYSWHPCQVYFSPTDGGLVIEYGNNGFQDILVSDKEVMMRIRVRSITLQDDDCTRIKPGDRVVVNQNSESETGFFDAEVEKVIKVRHSKRATCRCTFMIKWIHRDLNGVTPTVPSSSVMKLSDKSINNHPTISAFLDAVSPSNSCFSSMSPQLNLANDFDLDLHDLLEKQIEGIKNSVHGSKKRIRDEIMESETDIFTPNVKDTEKDKKSPLNPLAARAALASLMSKSNGIDDFSEITELSLETETVTKPAKNVKKPLFSTKKAKGGDVGTNVMNPETKTRLTRANAQKVESIPDDVDGKKQNTVTNRRLTRSVLHKEEQTVAIEIPTNDSTSSSDKKRLTRSALQKEEETVATEIPSNDTKNSSIKKRVTRSALHKEEETVANETTTIDTKNTSVAIEIPSNVAKNSRVTRSVLNKEEETVAIGTTTIDTKNSTVTTEIPSNITENSNIKRWVTRSIVHKEEETVANGTTTIDTKNSTVAIEIPSNVTENSNIKRRVTRSIVHKDEEIVAIETTTVDTKNLTVAIETTSVDTKSSSYKKRVTRSAVNQDAANIEMETIKESKTEEPARTEERNKTRNTSGVVSETQDPKGITGNVTISGGSRYGSKKNPVDMNKHKVLRSSPRFRIKT